MDTREVPPQVAMFRLLSGFYVTKLLALVARLGIADQLADGPRPVADLAQAAHVLPDPLYRALRALAGFGVFEELEGRRFALTPMAELLQSARPDRPESMRASALFLGEDAYRAWADLSYTMETGRPAFEHAFGAPHFAYLAEHPEANEIFNQFMSANSRRDASALLAAYDFSGARTVVDVAGGQGILLSAILRSYPHLRGVLFDLPHVVAGAEPTLRSAGVADRCEVVGGDFFESVPAGGDIYTLRAIIHDWQDERAIAILRTCAQAMTPQSNVLVMDVVMEPGVNSPDKVFFDMQMLMLPGGRERTAAEFERLFTAAGLRMTRIIPTQSVTSIIEGERAAG